MIQLTPEQRQAFHQGQPVRLRDADLGEDVVVCPAATFERMQAQLRELIDDEQEQQSWVKMSMSSLGRRLLEEEND